MLGRQLPGLQLWKHVHTQAVAVNATSSYSDLSSNAARARTDIVPDYESHTRVGAAPGKGRGLFITGDIPAHSLILSDYALIGLFGVENLLELIEKYDALPAEQQAEFDKLTRFANLERDLALAEKLRQRGCGEDQVARMIVVSQRFLANAFNLSNEDVEAELKLHLGQPPLRRAVFGRIARINHSCVPNVHVHYQPRSKSQVLYSLRPLRAGEEILLSYFDITLPRSQRLAKAAGWGFECTCLACCGERASDHEERLRIVRDAMNVAADAAKPIQGLDEEDVLVLLDKVLNAIAMAERTDGLVPAVPRLYEVAGHLQLVAASINAQTKACGGFDGFRKAVDAEIRITGEDSPSTARRKQDIHRLDNAFSSSTTRDMEHRRLTALYQQSSQGFPDRSYE